MIASTSLATTIHSTEAAVAHHLGGARVEVARILEVVREPAAERARLADVDHSPVGILELVGPGRVGDGGGAFEHYH